jgi:hypothetical protein
MGLDYDALGTAIKDHLVLDGHAQDNANTTGVDIQFKRTSRQIVRSSGDFTADGWAAGMHVTVTGSTSNNGTYPIANVNSPTVLTLQPGIELTSEGPIAGVTLDNGSPADDTEDIWQLVAEELHEVWSSQAVPRGWFFEWLTVATIKATPVGAAAVGTVPVYSDSDGPFMIMGSSAITLNLGNTGANGRHPDYTSEENDQFYDIYFIWGATPGLALLAVETGEVIVSGAEGAGEVSIDDVTGGTFTHWSKCCCGILNVSGDIDEFDQEAEGVFQYREITTALRVLNNGVATSGGTLDFTGFVPDAHTRALGLWYSAQNTISNVASCYLYRKSATSDAVTPLAWNLANASGRCQNAVGATGLIGIGDGDLASVLWYAWPSQEPTGGLTLYVMIWRLEGY